MPVTPADQHSDLSGLVRCRPDVQHGHRQITLEPVAVRTAREYLVALVCVLVAVQNTQRDFIRVVGQHNVVVRESAGCCDAEVQERHRLADIAPHSLARGRCVAVGACRGPCDAIGRNGEREGCGCDPPVNSDSGDLRGLSELYGVGAGPGRDSPGDLGLGSVQEVEHTDRAGRQRDYRLVLVHREKDLFDTPARWLAVGQLRQQQVQRIACVVLHLGGDLLRHNATTTEGCVDHLPRIECGSADSAGCCHRRFL